MLRNLAQVQTKLLNCICLYMFVSAWDKEFNGENGEQIISKFGFRFNGQYIRLSDFKYK